jgi:hypothetical protein
MGVFAALPAGPVLPVLPAAVPAAAAPRCLVETPLRPPPPPEDERRACLTFLKALATWRSFKLPRAGSFSATRMSSLSSPLLLSITPFFAILQELQMYSVNYTPMNSLNKRKQGQFSGECGILGSSKIPVFKFPKYAILGAETSTTETLS